MKSVKVMLYLHKQYQGCHLSGIHRIRPTRDKGNICPMGEDSFFHQEHLLLELCCFSLFCAMVAIGFYIDSHL